MRYRVLLCLFLWASSEGYADKRKLTLWEKIKNFDVTQYASIETLVVLGIGSHLVGIALYHYLYPTAPMAPCCAVNRDDPTQFNYLCAYYPTDPSCS